MNQEKINDLLHKVMDLKYDTQQVLDDISSMDSAYEDQTAREKYMSEDIDILILENTKLKLEAKDSNFDNTNLQEANDHLERCVADLKERLKMETAAVERLRKDHPTMPVIPKDVAIAIFREGAKLGAGQGLMGLCEREGFECRIHGIDDNK